MDERDGTVVFRAQERGSQGSQNDGARGLIGLQGGPRKQNHALESGVYILQEFMLLEKICTILTK
jgi:hypothetical protein